MVDSSDQSAEFSLLLERANAGEESAFDLLTMKHNNLTFIKVYNVSNNNRYKDSDKAYFIKEIKKYMLQKDMNSTFSFNVNFVEFIKNNKPKIETIEIV